jgi:hypothetical protein
MVAQPANLHFLAERTGCDRLRPATARQSLCGRCVVVVVSGCHNGAADVDERNSVAGNDRSADQAFGACLRLL